MIFPLKKYPCGELLYNVFWIYCLHILWGWIWENIMMIILSTSRICPRMSLTAVVPERVNSILVPADGSIEMSRADLHADPSRTGIRAVSQMCMAAAAMIGAIGMTAAITEADITTTVAVIETGMTILMLTEPVMTAIARRHPTAAIRDRAEEGAEKNRICSVWRSYRSRCCS